MLLVPAAIAVFGFVIYVFAVRALDEPQGTRWPWLAFVVAVSCAMAASGGESPPFVIIGAWGVAAAAGALLVRARTRS